MTMKTKTQLIATLAVLTSCNGAKEASVFDDAQWIGTDAIVLNAHTLSEFELTFDTKLTEATSHAAFYFGGNDERLLNRNLNHMGIEHKRGDIYMALRLSDGNLSVTRRGFVQDGKEELLHTINLPEAWLTDTLHVSAVVDLGMLQLAVNDSVFGEVKITPGANTGGDYIPYPMLGELACAGDATFRHIEVRNLRSPFTRYYQAEQLEPSTEGAPVAFFDPSKLGMPMLRSQLQIADKPIESATLYATSRGVYEMYINGNRIGADYFAPGCSQYNLTHYYQTYDIKRQLTTGDNTVTALMGEGWWMGPIGFWDRGVNHFGDQLALLGRIVVRYTDGTETVLTTSPDTWEVTTEGIIRYSSRFHGEIIDATKALAELDETCWMPAKVMELDGHLPVESSANLPAVNDYSHFQLLPQPDEGVQERDVLTAVSMQEVRPGVYVYDMGQNMAGLPVITFQGLQRGQQVRMRYAEVCYPDMPEYALNKGMVMMENIRAASAQDLYYAAGVDEESFAPHFTLHGYRYVEITGLTKPLPITAVKGRVLSSIRLSSGFECSNQLVNRLWQNVQWSTLANFISIPTDCPQRNERLGWGGDINVFSRTATYMADNYEFLRRHMRNLRDLQSDNGMFPDIAPVNGGFGGFLWGSAGIMVAYEAWRQSGRTEILEEHYDAMTRYMNFVANNYIERETNLFIQSRLWGGLGDWLNLEYNKLDNTGLYECYYIFELRCMAEMARALGKEADAVAYEQTAQQRKEHYVSTYIDRESGKAIYSPLNPELAGQLCDYQASYVLPLAFGVIDDEALRQRMTDNLVAAIERENSTDQGVTCPPYSLMTGFVTTAWISKALSDNGRADVAYRLLQSTTYPSWLYPVTQGATTIWERLNSYNDFEGFGGNNSMNSFNHYSFGAVGQWMMNRVLGIERDDATAGFRHFILRPMPDTTGEMTYARGWYNSPQGMIRAGWEHQPDGFVYRFTIPTGCTATLLIDGQEPAEYTEGEHAVLIPNF